MTRSTQDVESAFTRETNRLIAERFPIGGVAFVFVFAVAWLFEHLSYPERNPTYAVIYGLQAIVVGTAVLLLRRPQWRARAQDVAVVAALLISALVGVYYVLVQAQSDVMTMALLYISIGSMVSFPWGWERQLLLSAITVATLAAANSMGARTVSSLPLHLLGLSTIGALSASGAAYLQQQRLALFRQAAELRNANSALEEANRALEEANRTKNEFLASVSHELRTPLNIILGYADLLSDGELGPLEAEVKDTVDRMGRTCRTLVFLISDLLDLSRIEAGRLEVRAERVELAELFEDMRRFIEPRLVGRNITFRALLQDGARVTADRNRLEQILTNLLSNAAKFTERGSIELRARRNASAGNVEIEVTDTGVGISPEEAATLFEPFRQGEAGKRAGGVGVGLSLSARLATAMGGDLSLTSELGRGSTFLLRLPE